MTQDETHSDDDKITIESGSKADYHTIYARDSLDSLPLKAIVDGIQVTVDVSQSEKDSLCLTLDYGNDVPYADYTTGEDVFDPVLLDDLPAEFHGLVRVGYVSSDERTENKEEEVNDD